MATRQIRIWNIVSGATQAVMDLFLTLCKVFGVNPHFYFGGLNLCLQFLSLWSNGGAG